MTMIDRRTVLQGAAALALTSGLSTSGSAAPGGQRPGEGVSPIDVHHHYVPPFYRDEARSWLLANGSGSDAILNWSAARAEEALAAANVETAILSISSPGFTFDHTVDTAALARRCNDFAARLKQDHGRRFRFFTALPLPDVAASLKEVERGFDTLGATGVGLLTNYNGRYLGDPMFVPLFEELHRRRAIVHVHPTDAPCCRGLVPDIPTPTIEFAVDTGRTIASLLWAGIFSRYSDIRFIFSHGGGILPSVYSRISAGVPKYVPKLAERVPEGAVAALSRLYADTASLDSQTAFVGARQWVRPDHLLYGSDFPWSTPERTLRAFGALEMPPDLRRDILRANALKLFDGLP